MKTSYSVQLAGIIICIGTTSSFAQNPNINNPGQVAPAPVPTEPSNPRPRLNDGAIMNNNSGSQQMRPSPGGTRINPRINNGGPSTGSPGANPVGTGTGIGGNATGVGSGGNATGVGTGGNATGVGSGGNSNSVGSGGTGR